MQDRPGLYLYHVDPTAYPDYHRRPFVTPDWTTFNDTVQFVGGRSWSFGNADMEAPPNWIPDARVFRPNFSNFSMSKDSVERSLLYLQGSGKYLFNINAYGPGTPVTGSFGQFVVEDWKRNLMRDILKDRFMGFDLGEQDGRYWADARSVDYPMTSNYKERYIRQMNYMQKAARDQGTIISMLSVKGFWHYPMKDGYVTVSGAESQHKTHTSNNQVHYAFIRGASKQYGLLWYGDISVFNTWGYKVYTDRLTANSGPLKGNSLAWMRRMLFTQYQYNAAILGFESSKYYEGGAASHILSPIGELQMDAQRFVKQHPKPGPQYTPVALLQDFFSGWMTPSVPFRDEYKVWNYLPYQEEDYLLHNIFDKLFPGYGKAGLRRDEYGSLSATPYGDIADALLTDVSEAVLRQYGLVVLTSTIKNDPQELSDKLLPFVKNGGHLLLSEKNALSLFPNSVPPLPDTGFNVKTLNIGKGRLSIICNGLKKQTAGIVIRNEFGYYLDSLFKTHRLFSVGNDSLAYITNLQNDSTFLLGIYNNTLQSQSFEIKSHIGEIGDSQELYLTQSFENAIGYLPEGFSLTIRKEGKGTYISPGDVRFFRIGVKKPAVTYLPKSVHPSIVRDTYVEVKSVIGLPQSLKKIPGFFDRVSGLKINWTALAAIDSLAWLEDNWWYNLKRVQWAVEFDDAFSSKADQKLLSSITQKLKLVKEPLLLIVADRNSTTIKDLLKMDFPTARLINLSAYRKELMSSTAYDGLVENWDILYKKIAQSKNVRLPVVFPVVPAKKEDFNKSSIPTAGESSYLFSYHDIRKDLSDFIITNNTILREFGGVKVDGTYLLNRSDDKCRSEGDMLRKMGYKIVVDLSRELNNYPDLTWLSELGVSYERTRYILKNILRKMKILGVNQVVISSHMRPEMWKFDHRTAGESIRAGISEFIALAKVQGIDVYIKNMAHEFYPGRLFAKPVEVGELVLNFNKEFGNVRYAANWGVEAKPSILNQFAQITDMHIVAAKGSGVFDYQIPVAGVFKSLPVETVNGSVFIFDADYADLSELLADKVWVEENLKK